MEKDYRIYFVCYKPYENKEINYCKPIGEKENLYLFQESADIKHICKHIPVELRKNIFELKYPNHKIMF